jgi:tetratricopeptide (TPR) repeat protein
MSAAKRETRPAGRRRYPGARPFSDSPEDRQIFFGRDVDIERLFERVLGARLLVLFGKSGLGKTSLLMAGVFPRLREKPLLPVPIRLNRPGSPADIVLSAVTDACKRAGAELTAGDAGGIWEFLRTSLIWKGDLLLSPVLVFDQFEEIFTLRDAGFRVALAAELGALASGIPPERLRTAERRSAEPGMRLGEQPPEVKILLSLREEYLGTLQELSGAIPGLFQERVRLAPLGEEDARLAICRPAARREEADDTPFETPPFEYEEDALVAMLTFLRGESRIIEPFQLQLVCCRAEDIVAARAKESDSQDSIAQRRNRPEASAAPESGQVRPLIRITSADLGGPAGMDAVLKQFYRRVIGMLGWRERRRARRLCEEGLLSSKGTRLMLDQTQIESEHRVSAAALSTLVDERLLRREQRLESLFYEISHDRLADSIEKGRRFRIPKTLRHTLRGAAGVAALTIVLLIWWIHSLEQARSDTEDLVAFLIGENLLEQLRPVGRNAILEEIQKKVQAYLAKTGDKNRPRQLRTRGLALRNDGDMLRSRGRLGEAIAKFEESAKVFERLATAPASDLEPTAELARAQERLGDALIDQGKITESLKAHREALGLRQGLYDGGDSTSMEATLDLANSNSATGRVLNYMGRPRQALVHLDRASDLLQTVDTSLSRSPRVLKALHDTIDNRAESLRLIGDAPGSRAAYSAAREITQEWVRGYPLSADARVRHVIAVSRLANEQMFRGAVKKALKEYGEINRAVDELVRWDDSNALWKRDLAATLILMAEAQWVDRQDAEALKTYDTALRILEGLAENDRSDNSRKKDLSWLHQSRGHFALTRREWKLATKDFTTSERYIAEAARADNAFADWQREWSWALVYLAMARSGMDEHAEAAALLRRGRIMVSTLVRAAPEATVFQEDLVTFYAQEVRALEDSGKRDEAAAVAREGQRALTNALATQPQSMNLRYEAYREDRRIGDDAMAAGRLDDAVTAYRKGLAKISELAKLEPDNVTWWENQLFVHKQIGGALEQGKRWADAEASYRNGIRSGEKAFAIAAHRADLAYQLFLLRLAIGDGLRAGGKQESALAEFERARAWIQKATEIDKNSPSYFENLSVLHRRIARTKNALGDAAGAEAALHACIEASDRSARVAEAQEQAPKQAERAYRLHVTHEALAEFLEGRGDTAGAMRAHGRALAALQRAVKLDAKDAGYRNAMGLVYRQTARLKEKDANTGGAEADLRAGTEAGQRAAALGNSADYANEAGLGLLELAAFYERARSLDKALRAYDGAATQFEGAVKLDPSQSVYHQSLSIARRQAGSLREGSNDFANARIAYDAAVRAGRRATELAPVEGSTWTVLYYAQARLAFNIEGAGDTAEALGQFHDALKSAERAAGLLPKDHVVSEDVAKLRRWVAERSR